MRTKLKQVFLSTGDQDLPGLIDKTQTQQTQSLSRQYEQRINSSQEKVLSLKKYINIASPIKKENHSELNPKTEQSFPMTHYLSSSPKCLVPMAAPPVPAPALPNDASK